LYCADTQEAVVCEMKLAEWLLNRPGALKEAYFDRAAYAAYENKQAAEVFVTLANALRDGGQLAGHP
jgi:hypothetical protein